MSLVRLCTINRCVMVELWVDKKNVNKNLPLAPRDVHDSKYKRFLSYSYILYE